MIINYDLLPKEITIKGIFQDYNVFINGEPLDWESSLKIRNHSPSGPSWSYAGSGCAQMALAILNIYLPSDQAQSIYQSFKFKFIAILPKEDFEVKLKLREVIYLLNDDSDKNFDIKNYMVPV